MKNLAMLRPANIPGPPDYINYCVLTTSPQGFDVPAGAQFVFFSANANWALRCNPTTGGTTGITATWPTSNIVNGTGSEINPTARDLGSTSRTTGISVIGSTAGGVLAMAWFLPGG